MNAIGTQYFTTTLLSGIVGSLAWNYISVNELQGSIHIRITIVNAQQVTWSAAPTATPAFTISNLEFHANMIKLSPEVTSTLHVLLLQDHTNNLWMAYNRTDHWH